MNKNVILEYVDYLLSVSLSKVNNIEDAKDLVSETIISALCAIEKGVIIENPKTYFYGVLNHKLMDKLRAKYSNRVVYYGIIPDFKNEDNHDDSVLEKIINSQDAEKIRESLSNLTKNYRDVLIRYYFYGQKIKQIAEDLGLNENTVKFRLSYGKMDIKEKLSMEKFEKQSFDPEKLSVSVYGHYEYNSENPFVVNYADHILDQNILILAYEKPITIGDLSKALGVAVTFVEPIANRLVDSDFMVRTGNKVYTNMIISTAEDSLKICKNDKKVVNEMFSDIWDDMDKIFTELSNKNYYKEFSYEQKRNFNQFAAIYILQQMTFSLKNKRFPDFEECKQSSENTHKGWWGYASANRINPKIKMDWSENGFMPYKMNGCFSYPIENYKNLKLLGLKAYDLSSGKTFTRWWGAPKYISEDDFLKCCYAIYSGNEQEIPDINKDFLEDIEFFINCHFLKKDDNKLCLNIPFLVDDEDSDFEKYLNEKASELAEKYKEKLNHLFDEKINYPSHIKGIPEFIQYQENGSYLPMAMVYRATADRYLVGEDLSKNPVIAMCFFLHHCK